MGNITDWFKKIWNMEVDAYQNLQIAIKDDQNWPITNEETGKKDDHARLKIWFKQFFIAIIIFFAGLFLIFSFFQKDVARTKKKYSHHGVNKYGESY
jgi:hypothetical protein